MSDLGIVVIGRNEGERLRRCLESTVGRDSPVVYVDSGSTDSSVALAQMLGTEVVELDLAVPFTAGRARNAGVARLLEVAPGVQFIQFVDGDCELVDGWLGRSAAALEAHPDWAVVCGRLRERFRDRTIYNRLADLEWDRPIGEVEACGGIAMIRVSLFRQVGGFNPSIVAGEEPELCLRLRRAGGKVVRIAAEMALHDIAMTRFGQWWRRAVRSGYGYAEGAARNGHWPERHWVREVGSITFWGVFLPLAATVLAWPTYGVSLALLGGYPVLYHRIRRHAMGRGRCPSDARLYAMACTLAKFPQAVGMVRFWARRLVGGRGGLIEYKSSGKGKVSRRPTPPAW